MTLTASMTKHLASKNLQKSTQSAKGQSATKRKNSNLSAAGCSKTASKRRASNQSPFGGAPVKKASISKPREGKVQIPAKDLSSEFGEDDVDDLPSPSELFGGTKSSLAIPESPIVEKAQLSEPEVACVDPSKLSIEDHRGADAGQDPAIFESTPETSATQAVMPIQESQPPQSPQHSRPIEIWDDFSYSSGEDIFTSAEYQDSTATTAPLASSTANTIRRPKRKASILGEATLEPSQNKSPGKFIRNAFVGSSTVVASESTPKNRLPTTDDSSTDWEDIDRGWYEEFQHLINFY